MLNINNTGCTSRQEVSQLLPSTLEYMIMNRILLNTIGLSKGNENILLQLSEVFSYFLVVVLVEVIGSILVILFVNEAIVNVFYFGVQWFDQNFKVGSSF